MGIQSRLPCNRHPPLSLVVDLNPEQSQAATHAPADGPLLVIAGAGTGKTLTLASRLAWLVQQGADPQRVLLLTFSRRAAAEMARRAARLLHQSLGLPSNAAPPVLPWCGTFHSVAARLLREEAPRIGLSAGFTVLDRADAQDLMAQTRQLAGPGRDANTACRWRPPAWPSTRAASTRSSRWPRCSRPTSPGAWGTKPIWRHSSPPLAKPKLQQQSLDFDDLLLRGGT